jgi:hypothetical protein
MSRRVTEMTEDQRRREREKHNAARATRARELNPGLPPYEPRTPRGPSGERGAEPYIPEGHELHGVSDLTDAGGKTERRWNKTRKAPGKPSPLPPGFDLPHRISRFTANDGGVHGQWSSYRVNEGERAAVLLQVIRDHVESLVQPLPPLTAPENCTDDLLTIYPLGDPHIGMLAWAKEVGEHFDVKIATRELTQCVRNLVARAPASKRAIVTNLGDFFHAQDNKQVTPHGGNKLDVDGRFGKVARCGLDMMVGLVEAALQKHEHVTLRNVPGNHDEGACFWIAETLRREFKHEPRVTVEDAFSPYQFDMFGRVLLGWAHTDGAKPLQLGGLMATDAPEMWGATRFRYWHGGHVHHLSKTEIPGCVVETHRTLAGKDAWHNWRGYRAGRSLQAITYHREWGEDSRITEGIERVRAAILREAA